MLWFIIMYGGLCYDDLLTIWGNNNLLFGINRVSFVDIWK